MEIVDEINDAKEKLRENEMKFGKDKFDNEGNELLGEFDEEFWENASCDSFD